MLYLQNFHNKSKITQWWIQIKTINNLCEVREFMTPVHFMLKPKARAEERYCRERTMKVQNGLRIWPKIILFSASDSAPKRKGEHSAGVAQVKGCQNCNKELCA